MPGEREASGDRGLIEYPEEMRRAGAGGRAVSGDGEDSHDEFRRPRGRVAGV